jgi:PHP family Zn ribbon phosphoesterase
VDYRVENLADKHDGLETKKYFTLLPLHEIISLSVGVGMQSKRVWSVYNNLIEKFGNEFEVLLHISREELLAKGIDARLVGLIMKNRSGGIEVKPGYDGEYGVALLGGESSSKPTPTEEKIKSTGITPVSDEPGSVQQKTLF